MFAQTPDCALVLGQAGPCQSEPRLQMGGGGRKRPGWQMPPSTRSGTLFYTDDHFPRKACVRLQMMSSLRGWRSPWAPKRLCWGSHHCGACVLKGDLQPKLTPLPQDWTVDPCKQPHREGDPSSKRGMTPLHPPPRSRRQRLSISPAVPMNWGRRKSWQVTFLLLKPNDAVIAFILHVRRQRGGQHRLKGCLPNLGSGMQGQALAFQAALPGRRFAD